MPAGGPDAHLTTRTISPVPRVVLHHVVDDAGLERLRAPRRGIVAEGADGVDAFVAAFRARHRQEYGYDVVGRDTEIVNCRAQAIGRIPKTAQRFEPRPGDPQRTRRKVYFGDAHGWLDTPVLRRERLPAGTRVDGPAIVEEMSSTTVVHPGQWLSVDASGNLVVAVGA